MNVNTQTAIMWLNQRVSPIPVIPRSKMPASKWEMWKDRLPNIKIIDYWFKDPKTNIGVICGGPSNLSILDFDNIDYYYEWRKDMTKRDDVWKDVAQKTYRVKTPRGMHLYLRTKQREESRKIVETSIDIRCSGNYTLVPPSIHPSGHVYESIGKVENIISVPTLGEVFPKPERKIAVASAPLPERDIFTVSGDSLIQRIKAQVDILQFVSQYTFVKRTSVGGRYWLARCIHPKHDDRHPSFSIDTVSNRARCQSSKCNLYSDMGLDVIDLYSIINNVSIKDAVRDMRQIYLPDEV
jgi:hypothetical protein